MAFKVVFKQRQDVDDRTGGWSTGFWWSGSSFDTLVIAEAKPDSAGAAKDLAEVLNDCLGNQTIIKSIRASEDGSFRNVRKQTMQLIAGEQPVMDSDYCTTALSLKLVGDNGQYTRVWLRGIPDACIVKGAYVPTATFIKRFAALKAMLIDPQRAWSVRPSNKSNGYFPVTNVTEGGVITSAGHTFAVGDKVRLSLVKNPKEINKVYRVTAKTTDTFTVSPFNAPSPFVPELSVSTRARKLSPDYRRIVNVLVERATSHRVGRPSDLLGGSH